MTLLLLKVTLLFTLGLTLPLALRRASAATRHLVIVTALAASLLVPGLLPVVPSWEVLPVAATPVKPAERTPAGADAATNPTSAPGSWAVPVSETAARAFTAPVPSLAERARVFAGRLDWAQLAAVVWAVGAALMLLILIVRLLGTHKTVRRSMPDLDAGRLALLRELARALELRGRVALRRREAGAMPMVWGLRRCVVLLPTDAANWSEERMRAVLAHELAHVARRDLAAVLLGHLACAAHWFHPFAWILKRRLTTEREIACDDMAIGQGIEPRRYATHLLDIAAACGSTRSLAPVMAARSQLEGRIMAILDTNPNRNNASTTLRTAIVALSLAIALPLASLTWARAATQTGVLDPGAVAANQWGDSDVAAFEEELRRLNYERADTSRLVEGLSSSRAETRAACAWALGESGDPKAVEPLVRTLEDRSAKVREWSVRALGRLRDPRSVDPLIDRLRDDNAEVREFAARALGDLGEPRAAVHLVGALDDPDPEARQFAVRALGDLRDPSAVEPLLARLNDPDAEVRQWIVRTLGDLRDERAIPAVRELLDDPDAEVQEWAARALGDLGVERKDRPWRPGRGKDEPLMPGLDEDPPKTGDPETIASLIRSLASDNSEVRQWSARSLGDIGDASAIFPLIELTKDEDPEVREWAIRVLGKFRDARAVSPLLETLGDREPAVREWSVRTLGLLQDARMFDPLVSRLSDPSAEVREWAARALGAYGDPRAIGAIATLTDDEDADVRRWAERAVKHLRAANG